MIVQRFLGWVQSAPAGARAEATSALARAYLYSDLADRDRADSEIALTAMLDDPSPLVRRALAEAFANARHAPHHCVSALANDQSDISSVILARSPLLGDAELIDCAKIGDPFAQSAIALRVGLSSVVASALVDFADREALISLAVNPAADVSEATLRRMLERFGDDGEMREAILSRPDLPAGLRADLVAATAKALSAFVISRDWMSQERASRVTREACEKGAVIIAADEEERFEGPSADLARRLRQSGQLTPALALRALLSGNRSLFEAMLIELTGMPAARVAGLVSQPAGPGFGALYTKAKLPASLLPAFRAAIAAQARLRHAEPERAGRLSRALVADVRQACEAAALPGASGLTSLLRQFEAEAAREDARIASQEITARAAAPTAPRIEIDLAALEAELIAA